MSTELTAIRVLEIIKWLANYPINMRLLYQIIQLMEDELKQEAKDKEIKK